MPPRLGGTGGFGQQPAWQQGGQKPWAGAGAGAGAGAAQARPWQQAAAAPQAKPWQQSAGQATASWQTRAAPQAAAGIKRPGVADFASAAKKPALGGANQPAIKVTSNSPKEEVGVQTLVGDYIDKGSNHGRKFFQKVQKIPGFEDVQVFLYYWDQRDGQEFSGWWFGDQVGGSQVWARCPSHSPMPPRVGWKIPWDAASTSPGNLFVDQVQAGAASASSFSAPGALGVKPQFGGGALASSAVSVTQLTATAKTLTTQVTQAEAEAKKVVATAQEALAVGSTAQGLGEAAEILTKQQTSLTTLMGKLTEETNKARQSGMPGKAVLAEFMKLTPRVRTAQASLSMTLQKAKGQANRAKEQEKEQLQEVKDAADHKAGMAAPTAAVAAAEDGVEAVSILAKPLIEDPPESADTAKAHIDEVEASANEAQTKVAEARKVINDKLAVAKKYAPDTRKKALAAYADLQGKLGEAQKKLGPYKRFRQELPARVAAKKALAELMGKLADVELEVEKAALMTKSLDKGQMPEDEVKTTEETSQKAQSGVGHLMRLMDMRLRAVTDAASKDELTEMKKRAQASKTKIDSVLTTLRSQREGLTMATVLATATERVEKVEAESEKCQEAELPFLKGVEVLPGDESDKAIKDCESCSRAADQAVNQASTFLKQKTSQLKGFSKETQATIGEELSSLQKKLDEAAKKIAVFKSETLNRKLASVMKDAIDAVHAAEMKADELKKQGEPLGEELEKADAGKLKEAAVATEKLAKEVTDAVALARKAIASKQRDNKAGGDLNAAIGKLQARLTTANNEIAKHRRAASAAEKFLKAKQALVDEEKVVSAAEKAMDSAEKKGKGDKIADSAIKEINVILADEAKALKVSQRTCETNAAGAPTSVKEDLQKVVARCKKLFERMESLKASTKDQRERVLGETYVEEATSKVTEMEKSVEKLHEVELPFLKGMEVLPVGEASATIKESEACGAVVQTAISEARSFIAAKNLEVKHFGDEASKTAVAAFAKLSERVNTAASKLSTFKKDTEARKRTAQLQEAGEKVTALETEIAKLTEVAKPFTAEGEEAAAVEKLSEDAANEECAKVVEAQKAVQKIMDETRAFVEARKKQAQGSSEHMETIAGLLKRIATAQAEILRVKKVSGKHEQVFLAKKMVVEAEETFLALEKVVVSTTEACAPLLEQGGEEFLVGASVQRLADGLREHMKEKDLKVDAVFKTWNDGKAKGSLSKDAFSKYLEKLPETISNESIAFNEERRAQMFKQIGNDKPVGLAQFTSIFERKLSCIQTVTLTDGLSIADSKTVCKLEIGEIVEAAGMGDICIDEGSKMSRMEVKSSTGKTGWATVSGSGGVKYLDTILPFTSFTRGLDKTIAEAHKEVAKGSGFLRTKNGEFARNPEAKKELQKFQPRMTTAQASIDTLKKKVQAAKGEFARKVEKEKNAYKEAKAQKAADAILSPIQAKVAALEADVTKLEEDAAKITKIEKAELDAFATPIAVLTACEKVTEEVSKVSVEIRSDVKEAFESEQLKGVVKGPLADAKRELGKFKARGDAGERKSKALVNAVKIANETIANARYNEAAAAFRGDLHKRKVKIDKAFADLVKKGENEITEAAFCKQLTKIGLSFKEEQSKLLFRHIQPKGGLSKRRFTSFVQQYFVVVKGIGLTDEFDIAKAKTLRKAELDELIEVLEGPKTDDAVGGTSGLLRVRGRALSDGKEGWISVNGNQGTPFLQEVEKPFYACNKEVQLTKEFDGSTAVRALKAEEVMELLEGPRKDNLEPAQRAKGKTSDGKIGWFTVKSPNGKVFAEASEDYYICASSVAMTDSLDVKDCKVVKKLQVGDLLVASGKPVTEDGIARIKGKTPGDDKEGYVTLKGNAGTVYASQSKKHFVVRSEVPLTKAFPSENAETLLTLEKDQAIEIIEGPKAERVEPSVRVRGRALSDGAEGWITLKADTVRSWTPHYRCLVAGPMHKEAKEEGADLVREIAKGELVELLEGPQEDGAVMRMKGRAEKDDAMGWVTLRNTEGKALFTC